MGNNRFLQEHFWYWLFMHFLTVSEGWFQNYQGSCIHCRDTIEQRSFFLHLIAMFTDRWFALEIGNHVNLQRCHAAVALKGLGLRVKR